MSTLTARVCDAADLTLVLADIERFIRRFVVLTDQQAAAVTLWVGHTHVLDAFDCTPYLQVTSATKRAGKTRLLEVLDLLVARPWLTGRTSAAALVRKVDADLPTLLLDESDAAFGGEREYAEALRGVLNSGYRKSGRTTLCVGHSANITFRDFSTFGAKVIAGIGALPDTVADRAIPITLKRRTRDEPVERFRERAARITAEPMHAALVEWSARAVEVLRVARPDLPADLNDRAQDVWEPLMAIADLAGGSWPQRVRCAAVALMGEVSEDGKGVELLHDIYLVFEATGEPFIRSEDLVSRLCALGDRPWATWRRGGFPITQHGVARLLKPFEVVPKPNEQGTARGYRRERFEDVWSRYPGSRVSECQNVNKHGGEPAIAERQAATGLDTLETPNSPMNPASSDTLTLAKPDREEGDGENHAGLF